MVDLRLPAVRAQAIMLVLDVVPAKHAYLVPTSTGHKVFVLEEAHRKKWSPGERRRSKQLEMRRGSDKQHGEKGSMRHGGVEIMAPHLDGKLLTT